MLVASLTVAEILLLKALDRRFGQYGHDDFAAVVQHHLLLLLFDLRIANIHIERSDDGVLAYPALRNQIFQLARQLRKCCEVRFIRGPCGRKRLLVLIRRRIGFLGSVGGLPVIARRIRQHLDMVAVRLQRFGYGRRHRAVGGQNRARIILKQRHGTVQEVFLVLADHAGTVLTTRARAVAVGEKHLIGRIMHTRRAVGLIEMVGRQFGHVAVVQPSGDLFDAGVLPRSVAVLGKVLAVDLLLDRGVVLGDLDGYAHRNLLPVEQVRQLLDQFVELQTGADIRLALAEFADKRFHAVTARLQSPLVGRGLLEGRYIFPLKVLRDRCVFSLGIRHGTDESRDAGQIGKGCRPVTALAVDDLVALVLRSHADRLQNAHLTDALGELLQRPLADIFTRIVRAGDDLIQIETYHRRLCLRRCDVARGSLRGGCGGCFFRNNRRSRGGGGWLLAALPLLRLLLCGLHDIRQFLPCVSRLYALSIFIFECGL